MLNRAALGGEIGHEDDDVGQDQAPRHVGRIGGVGATRPVELASRGEVVARLLEQPGDAVGDRAALLLGRPPIGLPVGVDRLFQVAVADVLLGDRTPGVPGQRPVEAGGVLPGGERAGLVVHPVLGGALADEGGAARPPDPDWWSAHRRSAARLRARPGRADAGRRPAAPGDRRSSAAHYPRQRSTVGRWHPDGRTHAPLTGTRPLRRGRRNGYEMRWATCLGEGTPARRRTGSAGRRVASPERTGARRDHRGASRC